MPGYLITISECVPWDKFSTRWCSRIKNVWGYSIFWLLDQTPQSNTVIMKTFCNTDSIVFQHLNVRHWWKRYCTKSSNNCYFRKCFIRHYQRCTSEQRTKKGFLCVWFFVLLWGFFVFWVSGYFFFLSFGVGFCLGFFVCLVGFGIFF